jgi:hypothetical protein
MANLLLVTLEICNCDRCFPRQIVVDDINSELFVGGVFTFAAIPGNNKPKIIFGCYTIRELQSTSFNAEFTITSRYNNCEECITEISNYLLFSDCSGNFGEITIDKSYFVTIPELEEVFYLDFYLSGREGESQRITGCFVFDGLSFLSSGESELISSTSYGNLLSACADCRSGSPIIYTVIECLSQNEYYISFPTNTYQEHLVTFTGLDGVTQYCGVVQKEIGEPITGLLVSDSGLYDDESNNCDDCQSNVSEKKKLINCLEPSDEIIVWASTLFTAGDVTNLSVNNTCYEISPDPVDPSEPVTFSELADFSPQEDCESCFECNGLTYDFSSCTETFICGELSYNEIEPNGQGYDLKIDGDTAYLLYQNTDTLVKFDLLTNTTITSLSVNSGLGSKMGLDSGNGILSIPPYNSNVISWVDVNTNNIYIETLSSTSHLPRVSYFNPNDNLFYVGCFNTSGSSFVNVYSASSYNTINLINTFGCGSNPTGIIQVGTNIFVSNTNGCLGVFDSTTYNNFQNLCIGDTKSIDYNPNLDLIYATVNNSIVVIDPNTLTYTQEFPAFPSCCCEKTVLYDSINSKIYVSDPCPNQIYEIDESTYSIVNTFTPVSDNQTYRMGLYNNTPYVITQNGLISIGCELNYVVNSVNAYEYLTVGESFYHPHYDVCCVVTDIRTDMDGEYDFYSLIHYPDCITCTGVTHESFYVYECNTGNEALLVGVSGTYTIGDFVRSNIGNSEFLCYEIIDQFTIGQYTPGVVFESDNLSSYTSCVECESGSTIGLTIINCGTLVESYVNVSLSTWIEISGFDGSLSRPCLSDSEGNCYVVTESCPIDNIYTNFEPSNFYVNCTQCRLSNQARIEPPRSAGTEYFECVICCDCGSTGSTVTQVSPPHPVWTDGYGTPVTQLNMVALGGMFGLNN